MKLRINQLDTLFYIRSIGYQKGVAEQKSAKIADQNVFNNSKCGTKHYKTAIVTTPLWHECTTRRYQFADLL